VTLFKQTFFLFIYHDLHRTPPMPFNLLDKEPQPAGSS
jgi:hypothetical protein